MIAKKTYIACWNPDAQSPFSLEKYLMKMNQYKLWIRNHDVRWRTSIQSARDREFDTPAGSVYEHFIMEKGDRMFVLRTGAAEPQRNILMYSGFFESDPFTQADWRKNGCSLYYMNFQKDTYIHPLFPSKFTCEYLQQRFPNYQWSGDNRGFVLKEDDAFTLEQEWHDYFAKYDKEFSQDGLHWCQSPNGFQSMYEWQNEDGTIEHGRAWAYMQYLKEMLNGNN